MLPALIGGAASIIGGLINRSSQQDANAANAANAARQEALQREFAQSGIQWKVEDARKAGVHPLYALGANTVSYSPVSIGAQADTSLGSGIASAGQDISRAVEAGSTRTTRSAMFAERLGQLSLEKASLENDLLRTQIARNAQQVGPAMPALNDTNAIEGQPVVIPEAAKYEDRPKLALGGQKFGTDPGTSSAQNFEDRYGELSDFVFGPYIMYRDFRHRYGRESSHEVARRKFGEPPKWLRNFYGQP